MTNRIDRLWYERKRPLALLRPLAALFAALVRWRRNAFLLGRRSVTRMPMPVLVVGNITVGGTGKSPFTAWLVRHLQDQGWRPVILSRGYGGSADHHPFLVTGECDPAESGDEPVMLAQQTGAYVVVDPRRSRGAQYAYHQALGDILVCDDGLQHYPLGRDLEFCIFDGSRGIGNGALLPAGPLREPAQRATEADFLLLNGPASHSSLQRPPLSHCHWHQLTLTPLRLRELHTGEIQCLNWLEGRIINAVAGIGNPGRYFDMLCELGAKVIPHRFPDHHHFRASDLRVNHGPLVMTAKDAVKCQSIAPENTWILDVVAEPDAALREALDKRLDAWEELR